MNEININVYNSKLSTEFVNSIMSFLQKYYVLNLINETVFNLMNSIW